MVRARGIEPPRGFPHMNLNHARLPIPPRARRRKEITLFLDWQSNFVKEMPLFWRMIWNYSLLGVS